MAWIYRLFAGECTPEALCAHYRDAAPRDAFYSQLYLGLYYEAERDVPQARACITQAASMQVLDDYMGWLALVHQHVRGWEADGGR
jgi:hypothetical protein